MSRTQQVGKAIKRAKRKKLSGKDRAAGEREDPPEDGVEEQESPEQETPKPDRMANWALGEARIVQVGDRALIKLAAMAVKGAAKRAKQINAGLDIAKGEADERINQADAVIALLKGADNRADVTISPHLLRCTQIGISFEIDKAVKARDHETDDLLVEDTSGLDKHLKALERLARDLGMQGDLGLERKAETEEEEPEAELELEGATAEA